eukprot:CAMPEP_0201681554 /NCGR_PEP_ID=MMETSP0494-20130426/51171_1 /ASSEMBLY_ACC=CAM_ASM_000839 /TAXON_ID=420259 /ORGANISM="Thalassiosira gravida, Strain GMp14c1" /LENGTH=114 /DNA_ID=CAMNT_0048165305 /DNA_START=203 /DNA_END=550 /DNA_ORIENTATION=-
MAHIKAKSMESATVAVAGSEPVAEAISAAHTTAVRDLMSSKMPAVEENVGVASHSTPIDNLTMTELPQDVNEGTGVIGSAATGSQMGVMSSPQQPLLSQNGGFHSMDPSIKYIM